MILPNDGTNYTVRMVTIQYIYAKHEALHNFLVSLHKNKMALAYFACYKKQSSELAAILVISGDGSFQKIYVDDTEIRIEPIHNEQLFNCLFDRVKSAVYQGRKHLGPLVTAIEANRQSSPLF